MDCILFPNRLVSSHQSRNTGCFLQMILLSTAEEGELPSRRSMSKGLDNWIAWGSSPYRQTLPQTLGRRSTDIFLEGWHRSPSRNQPCYDAYSHIPSEHPEARGRHKNIPWSNQECFPRKYRNFLQSHSRHHDQMKVSLPRKSWPCTTRNLPKERVTMATHHVLHLHSAKWKSCLHQNGNEDLGRKNYIRLSHWSQALLELPIWLHSEFGNRSDFSQLVSR
mmetsp:Transcript_2031/g.3874  ORF Transcript_2031/g.3874 Transcript_2031/m.3874 type:complete len:221 (+) Transcript_2031:255-917(+)